MGGITVITTLTLPARVVKGLVSSLGHLFLTIHRVQSALLLLLGLCLFRTMLQLYHAEEGQTFLETNFTTKSHNTVLSAAGICKQCWVEPRKVTEVKWPEGLDLRKEAGVCVYKIGQCLTIP